MFFEGLRIYLSTHKFQNTKSEDLWAALDLAYNNAQSRSPENERTSLVISENVRKVMERKGSLREREEREMGAKKERDMASVLDKMAKWTYSAGFPVLDIFVDSLKSEWDIHQVIFFFFFFENTNLFLSLFPLSLSSPPFFSFSLPLSQPH